MEAPLVSERTRERTREMNKGIETERSAGTEVLSGAEHTAERFLAIAVAHDGVASSGNGHGRQKLQELVDLLLQSEAIPATLCFYTEGVRWLTRATHSRWASTVGGWRGPTRRLPSNPNSPKHALSGLAFCKAYGAAKRRSRRPGSCWRRILMTGPHT